MVLEPVCFEVNIIAGDGNKAAYLTTPKNPGVPTYKVNLLQFWIDRMVKTATQARKKVDSSTAPIRAKHFISASHLDLTFPDHFLSGINKESLLKIL